MDNDASPIVKTNYYPIQCTNFTYLSVPVSNESNKPNDVIVYNYQGRANSPNVIYLSSSNATGNIPVGYQATKLMVCPTVESMIQIFPFLKVLASDITSKVTGAIVIVHQPITNGVPLYSCFLLQASDVSVPATAVLETLFNPIDYTKKSYQVEPFSLAMRDFVTESLPIVYEDQTDHHDQPCITVFFQEPIQVHYSTTHVPSARSLPDASTSFPASSPNTSVLRTSASGSKCSKPYKNVIEGMDNPNTSDQSVPHIPKKDDPNYTYQECTMVPVDGIDVNGGDVQYTFQVSQDSNLVSGNMDVNYGNNVSGVILYFLAALLIYFGVPFGYRTIMCNILRKMEGGLGGTATFIEYLRDTQNLFGMGEFKGFTILFNFVYLLVIAGLFLGAFTPNANVWSIYSSVVFMILGWAIGYVGVINNPLPPEC